MIAQAPVDGVLHPKNTLDTLGADAPEKLCKASVTSDADRTAHGHRPCAAGAARDRRCASCSSSRRQYGRLVSALVRPLLWLAVFAAGFRNVFGVAIVQPYDTYIPYDVYIAPGPGRHGAAVQRHAVVLAMVYDREMGLMRLLLTAPLPRAWILLSQAASRPRCCRCCRRWRSSSSRRCSAPRCRCSGRSAAWRCWRPCCAALMLGALGLLLSVHIKQLENFAGTMNFVIFPMFFLSTALYPLWKLRGVGRRLGLPCGAASTRSRMRWSGCASRCTARIPGIAPWVVLGTLAVCFALACWGYDPQRGFGALTKRGGPA